MEKKYVGYRCKNCNNCRNGNNERSERSSSGVFFRFQRVRRLQQSTSFGIGNDDCTRRISERIPTMAQALACCFRAIFLLLFDVVSRSHYQTLLGQRRLWKSLARFGQNVSVVVIRFVMPYIFVVVVVVVAIWIQRVLTFSTSRFVASNSCL